jgi:hypothetical protein
MGYKSKDVLASNKDEEYVVKHVFFDVNSKESIFIMLPIIIFIILCPILKISIIVWLPILFVLILVVCSCWLIPLFKQQNLKYKMYKNTLLSGELYTCEITAIKKSILKSFSREYDHYQIEFIFNNRTLLSPACFSSARKQNLQENGELAVVYDAKTDTILYLK